MNGLGQKDVYCLDEVNVLKIENKRLNSKVDELREFMDEVYSEKLRLKDANAKLLGEMDDVREKSLQLEKELAEERAGDAGGDTEGNGAQEAGPRCKRRRVKTEAV